LPTAISFNPFWTWQVLKSKTYHANGQEDSQATENSQWLFWETNIARNTDIAGNLAFRCSDQDAKIRDLPRSYLETYSVVSPLISYENQYDEREILNDPQRFSFRNSE